jgi:hypothetical protein
MFFNLLRYPAIIYYEMSFIHNLFLVGTVLRGSGCRPNLYPVSLSNSTSPSVTHSLLYIENDFVSRKYTTVTIIIGSYVFNLGSDGALIEMFYLNNSYGYGN